MLGLPQICLMVFFSRPNSCMISDTVLFKASFYLFIFSFFKHSRTYLHLHCQTPWLGLATGFLLASLLAFSLINDLIKNRSWASLSPSRAFSEGKSNPSGWPDRPGSYCVSDFISCYIFPLPSYTQNRRFWLPAPPHKFRVGAIS